MEQKKEERKPATLNLSEPLKFQKMADMTFMPGIDIIKYINKLFNLGFKDFYGSKLEIYYDGARVTTGCQLYFKLNYDNGKGSTISAFEPITPDTFANPAAKTNSAIKANWTARIQQHNTMLREYGCQNSIITQDAVDILYPLLRQGLLYTPGVKDTPKAFKDKGICLETVIDTQTFARVNKDIFNVVKFVDVEKVFLKLFTSAKTGYRCNITPRFIINQAAQQMVPFDFQTFSNNPNITELQVAYSVDLFSIQEFMKTMTKCGFGNTGYNGIYTEM